MGATSLRQNHMAVRGLFIVAFLCEAGSVGLTASWISRQANFYVIQHQDGARGAFLHPLEPCIVVASFSAVFFGCAAALSPASASEAPAQQPDKAGQPEQELAPVTAPYTRMSDGEHEA